MAQHGVAIAIQAVEGGAISSPFGSGNDIVPIVVQVGKRAAVIVVIIITAMIAAPHFIAREGAISIPVLIFERPVIAPPFVARDHAIVIAVHPAIFHFVFIVFCVSHAPRN